MRSSIPWSSSRLGMCCSPADFRRHPHNPRPPRARLRARPSQVYVQSSLIPPSAPPKESLIKLARAWPACPLHPGPSFATGRRQESQGQRGFSESGQPAEGSVAPGPVVDGCFAFEEELVERVVEGETECRVRLVAAAHCENEEVACGPDAGSIGATLELGIRGATASRELGAAARSLRNHRHHLYGSSPTWVRIPSFFRTCSRLSGFKK